jgi:translation initiation factor IF-1
MFFPQQENILPRRITMKHLSGFLAVSVLIAAAVLAGCASTSATSPGTAFTGEVWTWDEQTGTVTLRQGLRDIRVNISPEQMAKLRLHETKTVYGQLAPPAELPLILVEVPSTVVPRGAADEMEVAGTIAAVDPAGRITVNAPQGAIQVWRATDGVAFAPGSTARVRMRVQPLDVVLVRPGQTAVSSSATVIEPAASPRTEHGDYAVIIGRVLAVDPSGRLTVDSSRGPVNVWVSNPGRYKINDTVEVRTSVHPG